MHLSVFFRLCETVLVLELRVALGAQGSICLQIHRPGGAVVADHLDVEGLLQNAAAEAGLGTKTS